jgi:hypothetical protein
MTPKPAISLPEDAQLFGQGIRILRHHGFVRIGALRERKS